MCRAYKRNNEKSKSQDDNNPCEYFFNLGKMIKRMSDIRKYIFDLQCRNICLER